jgi:hypothetical protein
MISPEVQVDILFVARFILRLSAEKMLNIFIHFIELDRSNKEKVF